jgi:hypothetical protein
LFWGGGVVHNSLTFASRGVLVPNLREKWLCVKCRVLVISQTAHIATTAQTTRHLLGGDTTSRDVLLHCALSFVVFFLVHSLSGLCEWFLLHVYQFTRWNNFPLFSSRDRHLGSAVNSRRATADCLWHLSTMTQHFARALSFHTI